MTNPDEDKYRSLFDQSLSGMILVDAEGRIAEINREASQTFGWTSSEMIGRLFEEFFDPKDAGILLGRLERRQTLDTSARSTAIRKDQSRFAFGYRMSPIHFREGAMTLVVGRNVTDLETAERRYQRLFRGSVEPILLSGVESNQILDCNPAFERLVQRSTEELRGMAFLDLLPEAERPRIQQMLDRGRGLVEGDYLEYESRLLRENGGEISVAVRAASSDLGSGRILIGYFHDLSLEKAAEARYRHLFLRGFDPIIFYDHENPGVLDANPAFEALSGFSASELKAMGEWFELLRGEDAAPLPPDALLDVLQSGEERSLRLLCRKGDSIPVRVRGMQLAEAGLSMLTIHDATLELRAAELERQMAQSQKMRSLGQMASGIAHDFNNTLMAALPWADLLRRKYPHDPHIQKSAEHIRQAVHRAKDVTRQLLDFAQPRTPQWRVISLAEMVRHQRKMLRPALPPEIDLVTDTLDDEVRIQADPSLITQAFFNLALNARDAMPDGGRLTVEVRAINPDEAAQWGFDPDRFVVFAVRDTGVGMSHETISRIFDPFFTTKDVGKGAGLGLAVVHQIAQQHGGEVRVSSRDGAGSSFAIILPRAESERDTIGSTAPLPGVRIKGSRILIIDDELPVAEGISALLEREGASTTVVTRGETALRMIDNGYRPDFLILDLGLPEMSGARVHAGMRERLPELPVVISSGYGDDGRIRDLLLDSRTRFVQKPYALEDLIRELIAASEG